MKTDSDNTALIYIHGAGLGSYMWDRVMGKTKLPAVAINFPCRDTKDATHLEFNDYINEIVAQIKTTKYDSYILVGHSIGGIVGLGVAEKLKDSVKGYVIIGSSVPKVEGSFASAVPGIGRYILTLGIRLFGTRPPKAAIKAGLSNDVSDADKEMVANRYVNESKELYFGRVKNVTGNFPTLYIRTLKDKEYALMLQDETIENIPNCQVATIDCGHMPMLTNPDELIAILDRFLPSKIS